MGSMMKRSRQFFRALFSKLDAGDRALIDQHLDPAKKSLFYNMEEPVQKHCVNVARTVQDICRGQDLNTGPLITAALIHDIGKTQGSFSLTHRVLYVICNRFSPTLTQKIGYLKKSQQPESGWFNQLRYAFYVHLNHERLGAELAREAELSQDIIFLIQNHHNLSMAAQSRELAILYKADEMN